MTHGGAREKHVVEVTQEVAASPEVVYDHIARVEGLAFLDGMAREGRAGRALVLVAPDARNETLLTVLVDAPEEGAAGYESRVRSELARVERLIGERHAISPDADGVGLDAIREEFEHGTRGEAPLAREP